MKKIINWFSKPPVTGMSTILTLRLMAGGVFFWEGILKFVYVNQGVGRFTKLGFPFPETTAHIIAVGEIIGGLLLIFGLFTRIVAFYFITNDCRCFKHKSQFVFGDKPFAGTACTT